MPADYSRDHLVSRGRALWSRTGSSSPEEAETAKRLLERFMKKHNLQFADLGPKPYKNAVAAPPTPPRARPRRAAATPPVTPNGGVVFTTMTGTEAENFLRSMGFGGFTTGNLSDLMGARVHVNVNFNPESASYGTTVDTIDRTRYGQRVSEEGANYKLHVFTEWVGLSAVVGRSPDTAHTFVGMQGRKWDGMLREHARDPRPVDLIERVQRLLKDTTYKIRSSPYPSVTELTGENEWEWVEIDHEALMALGVFTKDAIITLVSGIIGAARQFEQAQQFPFPGV